MNTINMHDIMPGNLTVRQLIIKQKRDDHVNTTPKVITMRQARLALLGAGLLPSVNAAIAAMPDAAGEAARIEWEYAQEVQRSSPLLAGMAGALGLTDEQMDALFVAAAKL